MKAQHVSANFVRLMIPRPQLPMMKRSVKTALGILLIIAGIIVTPLPIPTGLIMIVIGLSMLVTTVPAIRDWLKKQRQRYRETSGKLNKYKNKLPAFARKLIEDTDPEHPHH